MTLREAMHAATKAYLTDLLEQTDWNVAKAARVAGINRTLMHRRLRFYGVRRQLHCRSPRSAWAWVGEFGRA